MNSWRCIYKFERIFVSIFCNSSNNFLIPRILLLSIHSKAKTSKQLSFSKKIIVPLCIYLLHPRRTLRGIIIEGEKLAKRGGIRGIPSGREKKKKRNPGNLTAQGFATKAAAHPSKAHFRIISLMFPWSLIFSRKIVWRIKLRIIDRLHNGLLIKDL